MFKLPALSEEEEGNGISLQCHHPECGDAGDMSDSSPIMSIWDSRSRDNGAGTDEARRRTTSEESSSSVENKVVVGKEVGFFRQGLRGPTSPARLIQPLVTISSASASEAAAAASASTLSPPDTSPLGPEVDSTWHPSGAETEEGADRGKRASGENPTRQSLSSFVTGLLHRGRA